MSLTMNEVRAVFIGIHTYSGSRKLYRSRYRISEADSLSPKMDLLLLRLDSKKKNTST